MASTSLGKDKIRVLLLEGIHASAEEAFRDAGYTDVARRPAAVQGG
ncbi:MAG: phosphoglycerate dehydrogenase, partial [Bacteroidota bacterium]